MDEERLEQLLLSERLIGCAMRDEAMLQRLIGAGVAPQDFEHEKHREIWRAILVCAEVFGCADAAIVADHLERTGKWELGEPKRWILEAAKSSWNFIDDEALTVCADRLRHGAAMRRLAKLADDLASKATQGVEAPTIAAYVDEKLQSIIQGSVAKKCHSAEELANKFINDLENDVEEKTERIATGLGRVDSAMNGGAQTGTVMIVGADTGVGKTTFGAHMLLNMALAGTPVVYFTFETKAARIFKNVVEMKAQRRARSRPVIESRSALVSASGNIGSLPIWIHDTESMTVEELASRIHQHVKQDKIKAVFVDYVQDLERSTRHARDDLNFAHMSKVLRRIAARYDVLIVGFAQLSDTRADQRAKKYTGPTEADIAYTRQFAKDASYIVLLDRMKLSDDKSLRNLTRVRLVKNRTDSELTTTWMRYDPEQNSLHEARDQSMISTREQEHEREHEDDDIFAD